LRCADCGAELPSGAKFCDSCGKPVGEAAAPQPERVATRKTVTVLFSDLTGSTSLGERLDPESVRSMMGPVYAAMRSVTRVEDFAVDGPDAALACSAELGANSGSES
jgi:hypothetical protein